MNSQFKDEQATSLSTRLREVIGNEPVLSFSRRSGVGESTLRNILDGASPRTDILVLIAKAGGVTTDWLATGKPPKDPFSIEAAIRALHAPTKNLAEQALASMQASDRAKAAAFKAIKETLTRSAGDDIVKNLAAAGLINQSASSRVANVVEDSIRHGLAAYEYGKEATTSLDAREPDTTQEPAIPDGYVSVPSFADVRASAGRGAINGDVQQADESLIFKEDWIRYELGAHPRDLRLIRVHGDSMEPTLRAGDVVLVDGSATAPSREGIYILRMDDALLVKRLQLMPGRKIRVMSDNPAFAPWTLDPTDESSADVAVIGRVVWWGRRM